MTASGSPNTVLASSNETLCLERFAAAFLAFHSKRTGQSSMELFSSTAMRFGYRHNGLPLSHRFSAVGPSTGLGGFPVEHGTAVKNIS